MSVIYCEKHDRKWDSDFLSECPVCESKHDSVITELPTTGLICWAIMFDGVARPSDTFASKEDALEYIANFGYSRKVLGVVPLWSATCICGNPAALGVVHRADRPCFLYIDNPMPEPLEAEKKLHALYVAWLTGDPKHLVFVAAKTFQAAAQGAPK